MNFDDECAEAGFRVLAEVAKSTEVLFFTHHQHLARIVKCVVGAELHWECARDGLTMRNVMKVCKCHIGAQRGEIGLAALCC